MLLNSFVTGLALEDAVSARLVFDVMEQNKKIPKP
jgi:hypothetical protein